MADKKLSEQVAALETKADELQDKAQQLRTRLEQRADELSEQTRARAEEVAETASRKVEEIQHKADELADDEGESGGVKGLLMLVLAAVAAVGVYLKRKREQELDEALWEDPQAL